MNQAERERWQQLMMAAVDGELSDEEQVQFESMLNANRDLQEEYEQYQKLKEVTAAMKLNDPPQEVWDSYWLRIYNRIERGLAWILFSIGAITLLTYAVYHATIAIFEDPSMPLIIKLGILGLSAGSVILLVSIVRERWFTRKSDKYRKVQR